jgi:hypothetical protein
MIVPVEEDWGNDRADLDQKQAHDLFAGRSNEGMLAYFRANPIERSAEFREAERRPTDA